MCIAIVKPPKTKISDEVLRLCYKNNPDGAGYAFIGPDKKVYVFRTLGSIEAFIAAFRSDEAKYGDKQTFLIHFRVSTGGGVTVENCHPFVFEHGAFIHNGWFFSAERERSDTNVLVSGIGKHLTKKAATANKELLEGRFGTNNKIALLFKDGDHLILNEKNGEWDENGVWFSNAGYRNWSRPLGKATAPSSSMVCDGGASLPTDTHLRPSGHRWKETPAEVAARIAGVQFDENEWDDNLVDRRWAGEDELIGKYGTPYGGSYSGREG